MSPLSQRFAGSRVFFGDLATTPACSLDPYTFLRQIGYPLQIDRVSVICKQRHVVKWWASFTTCCFTNINSTHKSAGFSSREAVVSLAMLNVTFTAPGYSLLSKKVNNFTDFYPVEPGYNTIMSESSNP